MYVIIPPSYLPTYLPVSITDFHACMHCLDQISWSWVGFSGVGLVCLECRTFVRCGCAGSMAWRGREWSGVEWSGVEGRGGE